MSRLTKMVEDALLEIRQHGNQRIIDEYNRWIEDTEKNAVAGVIGYSAWLLKNPEKQEYYLEKTSLLRVFEEKVQGDSLVGLTQEDVEQGWHMIANYVGCLHIAKRLGKFFPFLKWDENWEQEITRKGKEGILSTVLADSALYEKYARALSEKERFYSINEYCVDLIIKKEVIKSYIGEVPASWLEGIDGSIRRLHELEDVAHKAYAAKEYNDWIKISEKAAENGDYEIPLFSMKIKIDNDNCTACVEELDGLWERIAAYESRLQKTDEIVKQYPSMAQDYGEIRQRIERKGRLNVVCRMAVDIRDKQERALRANSDHTEKIIQELMVLKEIFKLLEEGKL